MKIVVYPWDKNPYQSLLYDALQQRYPTARVLRKLWRFPCVWWVVFPLVLVACRLAGYRILHMHWWHALGLWGGAKGTLRYGLNSASYSGHLWLIQKLGYRIVWTVHNVLPHEKQAADDVHLMRRIAQACDAKIAHSSYALQQMQQYGLDTSNTTIIPHGNYAGVYPASGTRLQTRQLLGIAPNSRVILFFGKIRGYKGVADLLAAYGQLQTTNTRLLIVGQPDDEVTHQAILAAKQQQAIDYFPGHVADAQVAQYFMAADVVCLPFKAVTTSGSALLALTFGKPLVAPRSGALLDVPLAAGYFYDPTQPNALAGSLRQALTSTSDDITQRSTAAAAYADTLAWDGIAAQTHAVYEALLRSTTARK